MITFLLLVIILILLAGPRAFIRGILYTVILVTVLAFWGSGQREKTATTSVPERSFGSAEGFAGSARSRSIPVAPPNHQN